MALSAPIAPAFLPSCVIGSSQSENRIASATSTTDGTTDGTSPVPRVDRKGHPPQQGDRTAPTAISTATDSAERQKISGRSDQSQLKGGSPDPKESSNRTTAQTGFENSLSATVHFAARTSSSSVEVAAATPVLHAEGVSTAMQSVPSALQAPRAAAGAAFERMDSAAAPQVLESGPHQLAVGVRDAGLGWVEIRTHAAGGEIAAMLTASSTEAHAALSAQLPAMRDYLAAQHVHVDNLGSERFSSSSGNSDRSPQHDNGSRAGPDPAAGKPSIPPRTLSSEAYVENLSYISVRV
jgi:flagellar hook-length control protein FliK